MTDKAYIVANNKQELEVLNKFEKNNLFWDEGEKPTEWIPSKTAFGPYTFNFPYVLSYGEDGKIIWFVIDEITDEEIVYDGRKEEKMYKVTQKFMNELIKWRDDMNLDTKSDFIDTFVDGQDIQKIPVLVDAWWSDSYDSMENNNRLIAIIQWLNGEEAFEVEEPHKFVVRNDTQDYDGDYYYVQSFYGVTDRTFYLEGATRFDTREEAQEWANSHQVVVEIDEDGNEVD